MDYQSEIQEIALSRFRRYKTHQSAAEMLRPQPIYTETTSFSDIIEAIHIRQLILKLAWEEVQSQYEKVQVRVPYQYSHWYHTSCAHCERNIEHAVSRMSRRTGVA